MPSAGRARPARRGRCPAPSARRAPPGGSGLRAGAADVGSGPRWCPWARRPSSWTGLAALTLPELPTSRVRSAVRVGVVGVVVGVEGGWRARAASCRAWASAARRRPGPAAAGAAAAGACAAGAGAGAAAAGVWATACGPAGRASPPRRRGSPRAGTGAGPAHAHGLGRGRRSGRRAARGRRRRSRRRVPAGAPGRCGACGTERWALGQADGAAAVGHGGLGPAAEVEDVVAERRRGDPPTRTRAATQAGDRADDGPSGGGRGGTRGATHPRYRQPVEASEGDFNEPLSPL